MRTLRSVTSVDITLMSLRTDDRRFLALGGGSKPISVVLPLLLLMRSALVSLFLKNLQEKQEKSRLEKLNNIEYKSVYIIKLMSNLMNILH